MVIKQVKFYKTTDDKLFSSKTKAEVHQREIDTTDYMLEHPIYGSTVGCKVYAEDIREWLRENPDINKRVLIDLAQE